jgi:cytochrome c-type biogenesis protein CcmH
MIWAVAWLLAGPAQALEPAPETPVAISASGDFVGVVGLPGKPVRDPEELDRRTRSIGLIIRCPVCQGLSVADSSSDAAVAWNARIREMVGGGYSDSQVLDFFADRYGEFILLAPPKKGLHWLLWAGPLAAVGLGLGWLLMITRRPPDGPDSPAPSAAAGSDDDPYRARILAELQD